MSTRFRAQELFGPIAVVVIASYLVGTRSPELLLSVQNTLSLFVMVLALQLFVGNSGVLSFGHGAFAMVGAFVSGIATTPLNIKQRSLQLQNLYPFLIKFNLSIYASLLVAIFAGALVAGLTGLLLMRLSGLAAGIATLALLGVAYNVFFNNTNIGPGSQALPQLPKFNFLEEPLALAVLAMTVVYLVGISRVGRTLRATREDALAAPALGINIMKVRWIAFTISGGIAGLAGAMYSHVAGTAQVQDYYLYYTFMTLSMLIIGGSASIWGAIVGTSLVALVGQILLMMEQRQPILGITVSLPNGTRALIIALTLVVILLWRPTGLTRGREFALRGRKKSPPPLTLEAKI
jgi:branched-chain amino acid transport system permease protein